MRFQICTRRGVKVGEFAVSERAIGEAQEAGLMESELFRERYRITCLYMNINHKLHTYSVATDAACETQGEQDEKNNQPPSL